MESFGILEQSHANSLLFIVEEKICMISIREYSLAIAAWWKNCVQASY
jgi:hypothetical protein